MRSSINRWAVCFVLMLWIIVLAFALQQPPRVGARERPEPTPKPRVCLEASRSTIQGKNMVCIGGIWYLLPSGVKPSDTQPKRANP